MEKAYFHVILVGFNLRDYSTKQGKIKKYSKHCHDLLEIDLSKGTANCGSIQKYLHTQANVKKWWGFLSDQFWTESRIRSSIENSNFSNIFMKIKFFWTVRPIGCDCGCFWRGFMAEFFLRFVLFLRWILKPSGRSPQKVVLRCSLMIISLVPVLIRSDVPLRNCSCPCLGKATMPSRKGF